MQQQRERRAGRPRRPQPDDSNSADSAPMQVDEVARMFDIVPYRSSVSTAPYESFSARANHEYNLRMFAAHIGIVSHASCSYLDREPWTGKKNRITKFHHDSAIEIQTCVRAFFVRWRVYPLATWTAS